MRILIVDDDPSFRRGLARMLERRGHEAATAADGDEALGLLTAPDPPRVAVVDWQMPGKSGLEICRSLRDRPDRPYTYVIMLSGRSDQDDRVLGLEAGADDYLSKPFDARELEARLRTAQRILSASEPAAVRVEPAPTLRADEETLELGAEAVAPTARELASRDPLVGRTIADGKYRLDSVLGSGSSGVVYRGVHAALGRPVAIKILHPLYQAHPRFVGRFEREARASSRLDHDGITRLLDFGRDPGGLCYIVMEYLAGRTLDQLLACEGALPVERAVDLMIQVLAALAAAHENGIVHRDMKPENVMIVPDAPGERVKVCDFGIAKIAHGGEAGGFVNRLTETGTLCGTPQYMAPEQASGGDVDARADLYACGVILYELVTGTAPFLADSPLAVMSKHVFETPEAPSRKNPSVSPALERAILGALQKRPEHRPPGARAFRDQLLALVDDRPSPR